MKIYAIILSIIIITLCSCRSPNYATSTTERDCIFIQATLSMKDLKEIISVIRAKDNAKILLISSENMKDNEINVETGIIRGPLAGHGNTYILRHEKNKWVIIEYGIWDS